jgi:hypothetical protein
VLRSSINRLSSWSAVPDQSVGIAIGRSEIAAVGISAGSPQSRVRWVRRLPAPAGWFSGDPSPEHAQLLRDVLVQLVPEVRNQFACVHVALPDPLGTAAVFELDDLPKSAATRRQLARWRIAKELGFADGDIDVRYQDLGSAGGKHLLFSQAVHAGWLVSVKSGLMQAGVTAWSINQAVCFRFNEYQDPLAADRAPGALLALDSDAWTVAIWDAAARLRFIRSRWRRLDKESSAAEPERIVDEFERAVLAYVHGDPARAVERVYIGMAESERDVVAAALNRRLHQPCIPLAPDVTDENGASSRSGTAELALIAACA